MAGGAAQFIFLNSPLGGVWMFLIGVFLRNASTSSYQQTVVQETLGGMSAGDLARRDFDPIDPEMTVAHLVDQHMLTGHGRAYPVMAGEELLGLITLSDVRRLDRAEWPNTSVYRAMTPIERLHTVPQAEPGLRVLQMMAEADVNQVPVMDGRRLVGIIGRGEIVRLMQLRGEIASR